MLQTILFRGKDAPSNPNLQSLKPGNKAVRVRDNGFGEVNKYQVDVVTIQKIEGHNGDAPGKQVKTPRFDAVDRVHFVAEGKTDPESMLVGTFGYQQWKNVATLRFPNNDPYTGIHTFADYLAKVHPILTSKVAKGLEGLEIQYQRDKEKLQTRKTELETFENSLK